MNINGLLIPTLIIAIALFYGGRFLWSRCSGVRSKGLLLCVSILISIPAFLLVIYYLHWFDDAVWFYRFRTMPLSEVSACGAGLAAGIFSVLFKTHKLVSSFFVLCLLFLGIFIPHSKSILYPADYEALENDWINGICRQSSNATCGPASAATILRHYGIETTEQELARECFSYIGGTEIWYIARALQNRDVNCQFMILKDTPYDLPYPSIAGIDIGSGHFITILDKEDDMYILGDPLIGRKRIKEENIFRRINFTGFFLVIKKPGKISLPALPSGYRPQPGRFRAVAPERRGRRTRFGDEYNKFIPEYLAFIVS